jgi:hypothetical protein
MERAQFHLGIMQQAHIMDKDMCHFPTFGRGPFFIVRVAMSLIGLFVDECAIYYYLPQKWPLFHIGMWRDHFEQLATDKWTMYLSHLYYGRGAHSTSSLPIDQAKVGMGSAILLLFGVDGPFCSGHFNPLWKAFFYYGFGQWQLLVQM